IAEIPDNIRHCRSLQTLDCSGNPLAKNLPPGFIHLRNLSQLTLNDVSLTQLPDEIGSLTNLRLLEVRENLLKSLPESLTQLQRLESLDLGSNEIEQLPSGIGRLASLRELWLDINELNQIPVDIGHLKRLQCLDISDNKLTQLPNEIGDLESLTNFELSTNQLDEIPATIGRLSKLLILKIDSNNLGQLCSEIGQCTSLNELILTENALSELPTTIGNLKKLSNLNVDRNQLTLLPVEISKCESLGVLSLRDNRLTRIPNELSKLKHLHVLDLSGNRLPYLPCSLLDCDLKAIWLAENQAQPMLKFQTDIDSNTGEKILTCYLLPQQHYTTASMENLLSASKSQSLHIEPTVTATVPTVTPLSLAQTTPAKYNDDTSDKEDRHERTGSVKFADQFEDIKESSLQRHNTPHPKDLRTWRNKVAKKLHTDGHILHHHGHGNQQHSGSIPSNNTNDEYVHDVEKEVNNKQQPLSLTSLQNKSLPDGSGTTTNSSHAHDTIEYCPPETSSGYQDSDTEHNPDNDHDDVYHSGDQSLVEKHVEFSDDTTLNEGEKKDSISQKLHRRDTPHHLKNKRILNKNADQLSIEQILNQSPNKTSVTSPVRDLKQSSSRPMTIEHEQLTLIIRRTQNLGLGISIAGGIGSTAYKDNDYGIFITKVNEEGPAGQAGLITGDKLLSVNGISLNNVEHRDAVSALKNAGDNIEMVVLRELIIPSPSTTVGGDHQKQHTNALKEGEKFTTIITRDDRGFGFSIAGGRNNHQENADDTEKQQSPVDDNHDLYISRLTENGAADKQGEILVGDRILAINGYDVSTASHDQAVDIIMNVGKSLELVLYREKYLTQQEQEQQQSRIDASKQRNFDDYATKGKLSNKDSVEKTNSIDNTVEEVRIVKGAGPMGLSIVGGMDQACHPFGITERGVFVSKIQPSGSASRTNLRIGDRILKVSNRDVSQATHMDAVNALIEQTTEVVLLVRHEPQPAGLKEIQISRATGEPLGIRINGGVDGKRVNPDDQEDDGIFVTEVKEGSPAYGHLTVGTRILEATKYKNNCCSYSSNSSIDEESIENYCETNLDDIVTLNLNKSKFSTYYCHHRKKRFYSVPNKLSRMKEKILNQPQTKRHHNRSCYCCCFSLLFPNYSSPVLTQNRSNHKKLTSLKHHLLAPVVTIKDIIISSSTSNSSDSNSPNELKIENKKVNGENEINGDLIQCLSEALSSSSNNAISSNALSDDNDQLVAEIDHFLNENSDDRLSTKSLVFQNEIVNDHPLVHSYTSLSSYNIVNRKQSWVSKSQEEEEDVGETQTLCEEEHEQHAENCLFCGNDDTALSKPRDNNNNHIDLHPLKYMQELAWKNHYSSSPSSSSSSSRSTSKQNSIEQKKASLFWISDSCDESDTGVSSPSLSSFKRVKIDLLHAADAYLSSTNDFSLNTSLDTSSGSDMPQQAQAISTIQSSLSLCELNEIIYAINTTEDISIDEREHTLNSLATSLREVANETSERIHEVNPVPDAQDQPLLGHPVIRAVMYEIVMRFELSKTPHSPSSTRQPTTPPLMRHSLQKQQQ
ncbi:unnamed protein product, partial [Didymodactylos carnosus]